MGHPQVHDGHEEAVEQLPPVQLLLDGRHQLALAGRSPGASLRN